MGFEQDLLSLIESGDGSRVAALVASRPGKDVNFTGEDAGWTSPLQGFENRRPANIGIGFARAKPIKNISEITQSQLALVCEARMLLPEINAARPLHYVAEKGLSAAVQATSSS